MTNNIKYRISYGYMVDEESYGDGWEQVLEDHNKEQAEALWELMKGDKYDYVCLEEGEFDDDNMCIWSNEICEWNKN